MNRWIDILKVPSIIVSCIAAMVIIIRTIDDLPDRSARAAKEAVTEITKEMTSRFDTLEKKIDKSNRVLIEHGEKLDDQGEKIDGVIRSQATLKKLVTTEFSKTMTPAQVLDMMEQFDQQKKSPIVFRGNN